MSLNSSLVKPESSPSSVFSWSVSLQFVGVLPFLDGLVGMLDTMLDTSSSGSDNVLLKSQAIVSCVSRVSVIVKSKGSYVVLGLLVRGCRVFESIRKIAKSVGEFSIMLRRHTPNLE